MGENTVNNSFKCLGSISLPFFIFLCGFSFIHCSHTLYFHSFSIQRSLECLYWFFTSAFSFGPVCVILKMDGQLMYKVCFMYHLSMLLWLMQQLRFCCSGSYKPILKSLNFLEDGSKVLLVL